MAHRGKYYPVGFRRDFNLASDIRSPTAISDEYTIALHPGFAPVFDPLGFDFLCTPSPMPDPATLEWRSGDYPIAGHMWSSRLRIQFNRLPDTWLQATAELFRGATLAVRWRWIHESRDDPLLHGGLAGQTLLYVDLAIFPTGVVIYYSSADPVWYPP